MEPLLAARWQTVTPAARRGAGRSGREGEESISLRHPVWSPLTASMSGEDERLQEWQQLSLCTSSSPINSSSSSVLLVLLLAPLQPLLVSMMACPEVREALAAAGSSS